MSRSFKPENTVGEEPEVRVRPKSCPRHTASVSTSQRQGLVIQDSGMLNVLFIFYSVHFGGKLCDYQLSEMCWPEAEECWNGDKGILREGEDGYFPKASILLPPCMGF